MEKRVLSNGVAMPGRGFGVFQIPNQEECEQAVENALKAGYRLLDTASVYGNEKAVGTAITKSGINRKNLFVTTKAWVSEMGYERTKQAFHDSLNRLGLEYLDLYLIHMPLGDYYGAWSAMEELYRDGLVRAIGVCNFEPDRLMDLCYHADVKPMIDQVELHPFTQRKELREVAQQLNVQIEAWAPFAEGQNGIFTDNRLVGIGMKYHKTAAQVILRWHLQNGIIAIPKSIHEERIQENFDIMDFVLSDEDMALIEAMDSGRNLILDIRAKEEVTRLHNIPVVNE